MKIINQVRCGGGRGAPVRLHWKGWLFAVVPVNMLSSTEHVIASGFPEKRKSTPPKSITTCANRLRRTKSMLLLLEKTFFFFVTTALAPFAVSISELKSQTSKSQGGRSWELLMIMHGLLMSLTKFGSWEAHEQALIEIYENSMLLMSSSLLMSSVLTNFHEQKRPKSRSRFRWVFFYVCFWIDLFLF